MTLPIDVVTLDTLRSVQEAVMLDECEILRMTPGGVDVYGKPMETWAAVAGCMCGVRYPAHGRDLDEHGAEVKSRKGKVRLPHGTDARHSDRVKVTRRWGVPIAPMVFEVVESPGIGPTAVELVVELVTDGSD